MAVDAVNRIKAAEDEAEAMVRRAQAEARDAVRRAEAEGQRRARQIAEDAQAARQALLAGAEAEAARICAPMTAQGDEDVTRILHPDSRRFDEAVIAVAERIVMEPGE